jgi:hypothetical protein
MACYSKFSGPSKAHKALLFFALGAYRIFAGASNPLSFRVLQKNSSFLLLSKKNHSSGIQG